jgi:branched-subunit amino acid permease
MSGFDHFAKLKVACVPLFVGACFLFCWGATTLLMVPGDLRESYLNTWRFLYGFLPTLSGLGLVTLVGWLWNRSNGSITLRKAIEGAFALLFAAIFLFWIGWMIASEIRQWHGR